MITQTRLKEVLEYHPRTGDFTWRATRGSTAQVGTRAGCIKAPKGYRVIRIDNKLYRSSRLVWLYVHGYFPENSIDHKNRNTGDDKLSNLREVSFTCNSRNTKIYSNNKCGVKGVYFNKAAGKWHAHITIGFKAKNLGLYEGFEDAVCARLAAEQCLNWIGCDADSPAYQYVKQHIIVERYF